MTRLSSDNVLKEHQTRDVNSITFLNLTHKALSDVSCLTDFKNLERLDLSFNNLSSLEGLKSCVNLKWLSVAQNKLQSLKGIEGLSKLTVLNAGKNKLKSMDEVQSLMGLRALILNDNEIVSLCRLDQMKNLNTLVLSRNPIHEIGESLLKVKSITKLSLSNCQVQLLGSSLKFCIELKELRLAHNDIKTLPDELAYNKKLQNLDLGNNLISRWSDLKVRHQAVLGSLVGLKNLNLQGNPVAENDKLTKKVRKLLPNLHVFNAKPIDKNSKNEKGGIVNKVDDYSHNTANKRKAYKEEKGDSIRLIESKQHVMGQNEDGNQNIPDIEAELKQKSKKIKEDIHSSIDDSAVKKKLKTKSKEKQGELDVIDNEKNSKRHVLAVNKDGNLSDSRDVDMEKDLKRKRRKTNDKLLVEEVQKNNSNKTTEKKQKKRSKGDQSELDLIDDAGTSFQELFSVNSKTYPKLKGENKVVEGAHQYMNSVGALVTSSTKKKKSSNHGMTSTLQLSQEVEVGLGGPSTWGDE